MAISNQERVSRVMDLVRAGLGSFVEREVQAAIQAGTIRMDAVRRFAEDPMLGQKPIAEWDTAGLLKLMWETWNDVFRKTLGAAERGFVGELRGWRNKWAHQEPFSSDDTYRVLDSAERLLTAIASPQADEVGKSKQELMRLRYDEQVRGEKRKAAGAVIEGAASAHLKPWRDVVTPHRDVASGRYQQAEFAADLWQVHIGEGSDEYRKPSEFFRRTYLTESLRRLLVGAVERLSGNGGDPVVQLQTNFGGGKTHSMLALYHLFSGTVPGELVGIEKVMEEADVTKLPKARRVVLVGNKISPGNPVKKEDGTVVRTLWGELAWQLGFAAGGAKEAKKAFARIKADDERATNPGDALRGLFKDYGPSLILIDEWVAYARQLHDQGDLPAGGFETQFSFAQALTESAKLAGNCLLVISLPASDGVESPHTQADDAEVGGQRGREALERLRNVVGRIESAWRPASAEEGFEIVRRRLFDPMTDPALFKDRDVTARGFADLYRAQRAEFPHECGDADYEKRIQAAYPIHPEVFDRLYSDWSTLPKFQRTRGVLRLMAGVIHSLWEKGDRSPLILPANIPIDDPRVQFELTRYLSDNWTPILEKDVDGPSSLPLRIDADNANLGKLSACRRVARTIYLGSAPVTTAANRGIEDRRIKLGCAMPGESPAIFGDALRRLASAATYLYQDGPRYWYSTQPTVTKLAEDRAELLKRDPDKLATELDQRVRADLRKMGEFKRVYPMPASSADVPDEPETRLVVLPADHPYVKEPDNAAENAARAILTTRGNAPRLYQNSLVFLAADKTRMQDLDEALRRFLAWESIVEERETLNLTPQQVKQAENQKRAADDAVAARLPETFFWALVPSQASPQAPIEFQIVKLTSGEGLAVRASQRLKKDELLIADYAGTMLRKTMDDVPLWRTDHVPIKQLVEDFSRYVYLPRLSGPEVLVEAAADGLGLLTWNPETFAFADRWDEEAGTFIGLRAGEQVRLTVDTKGVLVKPAVAARQIEQSRAGARPEDRPPVDDEEADPDRHKPDQPPVEARALLKRFHGSVELNPERLGRDAGAIAEEIVQHMTTQKGAKVKLTLEIEAVIPAGASDTLVRTVTENARTLKFKTQGFEEE